MAKMMIAIICIIRSITIELLNILNWHIFTQKLAVITIYKSCLMGCTELKLTKLKDQCTHITKTSSFTPCWYLLSLIFWVFLPSLQYNGGKWIFICGAHSTEKLHLKNLTATFLSRNGVPAALDNPQTGGLPLYLLANANGCKYF